MPTHPLWNAYEVPSMDEINAARVEIGAWAPGRSRSSLPTRSGRRRTPSCVTASVDVAR